MTSHRRQNSQGKSPVLKVVLLGDGGVGKSCLMNRFVDGRFDEQSLHTVGVEFLSKDMECEGQMFTLQIWDTAGQERFKSLRTSFYRGSDLCLLTYAIDDFSSFKNLEKWKNEFLYYADVKADFPFIVVGNKIDLERKVNEEEVSQWCLENNELLHVETSAKTATNVEEAFSLALKRWINLNKLPERVPLPDTVQLHSNSSRNRRLCGCS